MNNDGKLDCHELFRWKIKRRGNGNKAAYRRASKKEFNAIIKEVFADEGSIRSANSEALKGKIIDKNKNKEVDIDEFDNILKNVNTQMFLKHVISKPGIITRTRDKKRPGKDYNEKEHEETTKRNNHKGVTQRNNDKDESFKEKRPNN